ncbi:MAG: hypothetical protein JWM34_2998 [Ilumatobacteraceae bacterium]|nr:hypothetical protein [Ilumatobacteraceae bacterium]
MTASNDWLTTIEAWVATFDEIAPDMLEGLYVVGSAALGDWQPGRSDIDVVAITAEPADEEMAGTLLTAHAVFVERHPRVRVDGPFMAWGDLVVAPQGVTRPWMVDGAFHHDAECAEINPVTWFTLARYGVRVRGPRLDDIPIPVDTVDMVRYVVDNALSSWRSVRADLRGALSELGADDTLPGSVAEWCLLGACRMLYTATTSDVTSKSGAGTWAAGVLDAEHRDVCRRLVATRSREDEPVSRDVLAATEQAMGEVLRRIWQMTE